MKQQKPTINVFPSKSRGHADHGWLKSFHSFSFASYHNPKRMNFGALRVLNDDVVAPSRGFGAHPHNNMEIISIVLEGTLEHKDNHGGHGVLNAGEVQHISAGSGIIHSEYNHSSKDSAHFLQIWIDTKEEDIKPSYSQKSFVKVLEKKNHFVPLVTNDGHNGSLTMHQDAAISMAQVDKGKSIHYTLFNKSHGIHLFVIKGRITSGNEELDTGDALEATGIVELPFIAEEDSQVLVIEVPL